MASVEEGLELAEIICDGFLQIALVQRSGGVEHGKHPEILHLERLAAHLHDADLLAEQGLHGEVAEGADHLGFDQLDLLEEKWLAGLDLVRLGVAVLRRAALDDVGDVYVVALQADRFDDLRQELPALWSSSLRSRPAAPTNGSPCLSS